MSRKGFLENKDTLLSDYLKFIELTEKEYYDLTPNRFILGYSLGGLFANLVCLEKKDYFSGMVLLVAI